MTNSRLPPRVTISRDGPYIVTGDVPLVDQIIGTDANGNAQIWQEGDRHPTPMGYALCRCGHSGNKPFCDGTHIRVGFDGTETASRDSYLEQAGVFDGPTLALSDAKPLCASARFCDRNGKVWNQVARTDDPEVREMFTRQVNNCPSGRLAAWNKTTQKLMEPQLSISIGLIEDPAEHCSGPIWLRGGIAVVSADGFEYEVRNRATLCRCGASQNKPFCDGTHASIKFQASKTKTG
jgi:CDGSH-type Zn-finger protein